MEGNVVLTMRDISKTFPGVKALQHVDFTLRKGEIHALMRSEEHTSELHHRHTSRMPSSA